METEVIGSDEGGIVHGEGKDGEILVRLGRGELRQELTRRKEVDLDKSRKNTKNNNKKTYES